jgi:hypothetical protein
MWRVAKAERSDVELWLRLAEQVEPLFGPMVGHGFEEAILANVRRGSAFRDLRRRPFRGPAARRFYESFGFVAGASLEPGPDGGSRQELTLEQAIA